MLGVLTDKKGVRLRLTLESPLVKQKLKVVVVVVAAAAAAAAAAVLIGNKLECLALPSLMAARWVGQNSGTIFRHLWTKVHQN